MKIKRNPDICRVCLSCARRIPEPDFPTAAWYCAACIDRPAAMPLVNHMGRECYDTRRVFQGLRVKWVEQGDSRHQREQFIPARLGEFYAVAENCVGFVARSGKTANKILATFPDVRCFTRSDNGEVVLHIPVETFPAVAAAVGVRKKKVLSEAHKEKLRQNIAKARSERMTANR